jgi:putative flippase GtrA
VRIRASLRHFHETFQVLVHEVAKFTVVGAFNYALDVGLFNLLVVGVLHDRPLTAKGISSLVAMTTSYFMNRHWTFRHRASSGLAREYARFTALSAVAVGITLGCLAFSEYVLDLHSLLARNIAGNVVGVALAMVFRFWSFKRWVFLAPPSAVEAPERNAAEATVRTTF